MLEVDGKQLFQSGAILRYLANQFGLAGQDELEKAKVDEVFDFFKDVYTEIIPYVVVKGGWREGNLVSSHPGDFFCVIN
jgi:glutathione S-transferase